MTEDRPGGHGPEFHSARTGDAIPGATVARLPVYLRAVVAERDAGASTISSDRLAELAGVNAAKVRKDLSFLGSYGIRGVGYDVTRLMMEMSRQLGLSQDWPCVIVGAGNLGAALVNYLAGAGRGFSVAAIVDADADKWGTHIGKARWRSTATTIYPAWSPRAPSSSASSRRPRPSPRMSPTSWSLPA